MPQFDWTITLGTVLHLIGTIVLVVGVYYGLKAQIVKVETDHQYTSAELKVGLGEIRADVKEIKHDLIGSLEGRVRALEIQAARGGG